MKKIEKLFGPFDKQQMDFYINEMKNQNGELMNGFQRQLIFNLFYKYFADTQSINAINMYDYVKLMLAAKKMLSDNMMTFMPYIISSKVDKVVARKTLNKREMTKMEQSQYYPLIMQKYNNEKIQKQILVTIATIITSNFRIIDYNPNNNNLMPGCNGDNVLYTGELNGKVITIEPDMIIEEALLYILLI